MTYESSLSNDCYKEFHVQAGHPDIIATYENFTNRNNKLSNVPKNTAVVNLGWQYFIKKYLIERWNETFFKVDKAAACKRHQVVMSSILGYTVDVKYLEQLHDLGYLPLRIKSLPEGTLVPYQVASATFESTVSGFEWLPGKIETLTSQTVWPMQTAATTGLAYLRQQRQFFEATGGPKEILPFMIHDFSSRGMVGEDASAMMGFGHIAVGNMGSDTIVAGLLAEEYYGADWEKELILASVNATEHSVTCGWIKEGEEAYFRHLMNEVAPEGILAVVSDTWDFWHTVTVTAENLKDDIMARDGKVVFRPDSGDPVEVLCGMEVKTLTWSTAATFKEWKGDVANEIDEIFRANLDPEDPHFTESEVFSYEGEIYKVTYEPELNRHDKTYYYVDNWKNDVEYCTFTKIDPTPEQKGLVEVLWEIFGGTVTEKGYKMLDEHVGAIYGDAITLERQKQIGKRLMAKGFVPQVVLGVGSYSYQYVTRDTHGSAMKATNVTKAAGALVYDQEIFKDPKTDAKKKSAKGLLRIERENGKLVQYDMQTREQEEQGLLQVIFEDGVLYNEQSLQDIRDVVASQL